MSLFQLLISLFLSIYFQSRNLIQHEPVITHQPPPPQFLSKLSQHILSVLPLKYYSHVFFALILCHSNLTVSTRQMQWSDFSPIFNPLIYMTQLHS